MESSFYKHINMKNALSVAISCLIAMMIRAIETDLWLKAEQFANYLLLFFALYLVANIPEWLPQIANWIADYNKRRLVMTLPEADKPKG